MKIVHKKLIKHLIFLIYRRCVIYIHRKLRNVNLKIKYPHIIEIELTNDCNLKCKHCHKNVMGRPIGYMEFDVFKKIIDEISSYPVAFLRIVGLGESSMHPDFLQMLRYASNKGIKIEIATNGELIKRFLYNEILSLDIDILGVSVDGIDKKSYERIRVGVELLPLVTGDRESGRNDHKDNNRLIFKFSGR